MVERRTEWNSTIAPSLTANNPKALGPLSCAIAPSLTANSPKALGPLAPSARDIFGRSAPSDRARAERRDRASPFQSARRIQTESRDSGFHPKVAGSRHALAGADRPGERLSREPWGGVVAPLGPVPNEVRSGPESADLAD